MIRPFVLFAATGLLAVGCLSGRVGFTVRNETNETATVVQRFERAFPVEIVQIAPRQATFIEHVITEPGACTTGALVAQTSAGKQLARLDTPLCNGQTWVIRELGSNASEVSRSLPNADRGSRAR